MNCRSAFRIMVGYWCKGHRHEPEINRFLQSRRYIYSYWELWNYMNFKTFQFESISWNVHSLETVTLPLIYDQFNCKSLHRYGSGPCGRNWAAWINIIERMKVTRHLTLFLFSIFMLFWLFDRGRWIGYLGNKWYLTPITRTLSYRY